MVRFEDEMERIRSLIFLAENRHNQHSISAFAESAMLSIRNSADQLIAAKKNHSELSRRYRAKHPYMVEANQKLRATAESFDRTLVRILNSSPIAAAIENQQSASNNQSPWPKSGTQDSPHYRRIKQLEDEVQKLRTEVEDLRKREAKSNERKVRFGSSNAASGSGDLIRVFLQESEFRDHPGLHVELSSTGLWICFLSRSGESLVDQVNSELSEYGRWLVSKVAWEIARDSKAQITIKLNQVVVNNSLEFHDYLKSVLISSGIKEGQILDTAAPDLKEHSVETTSNRKLEFSLFIKSSSEAATAK